MSFYSKISLFALLAAGTALGMELPPRLKAPATSAAAQALNQPMIKVFSPNQHIDTIQRNYLEASATLKNMLENVDANQVLVLPESMIEDYLAIDGLLGYEHRLNAETSDKKTALDLLKSKTEQQLVSIANACQRFELNKVGELAITLLAEKLNTSERKEECLKNGSYNLNWTHDVAHLVAQEMTTQNPIPIIYWLFLEEEIFNNKYKCILIKDYSSSVINGKKHFGGSISYHHCSVQDLGFHRNPIKSNPLRLNGFSAAGITWHIANKKQKEEFIKYSSPGHDIDINKVCIIDINGFTQNDQLTICELSPHNALDAINKLTPEEITLLSYCYECQTKKESYNLKSFPGINVLKKKLPQNISKVVFYTSFANWWQRRSWFSKAALITGGVAATGLAAWYGYKYFNKK